MRLWLSFSLLFLALHGREINSNLTIAPCPPNTACMIFVKGAMGDKGNKCTVNGVPEARQESLTGYAWDADTRCDDETYRALEAELEIEPQTLQKWRIKITRNDFDQGNPDNLHGLGFEFDGTIFEFQKDLKMVFRWRKNGEKHSSNHTIEKEFYSLINDSKLYNFVKYSFEIDAGREKLINLIDGQDVRIIGDDGELNRGNVGKRIHDIKDPKFAARLDQLNICDLSEIKQVCYGSCDKLTNASAIVACPSTLWFSEGGLRGVWKAVDNIRCKKGSWHAEWNGGTQLVDETLEIQCSAKKPEEKPANVNKTETSVNKTDTSEQSQSASQQGAIIGFAVGGVLLIAGLLVAGFFLFRALKRRKEKPTVHSVRVYDLSSPKQKESARTPGETMPEYTAQTEFEGLKTEILEEKTATAKLTERSIEKTKGSTKRSHRPSTATASIKVDTATFTPTFTEA